jgi:hypothetical protein
MNYWEINPLNIELILYSKVSLSLIIRRYVRKTPVNINKSYMSGISKTAGFYFLYISIPSPLVGE